jgi:hypothetical protein
MKLVRTKLGIDWLACHKWDYLNDEIGIGSCGVSLNQEQDSRSILQSKSPFLLALVDEQREKKTSYGSKSRGILHPGDLFIFPFFHLPKESGMRIP